MFRVALRSIVANKVRFLLPAFAVVLGVAFVAGALIYGESVRASLDRVPTDFAVQVSGRSIDHAVSPQLVEHLRGVPGAKDVRPVAEGSAFLVGKDGSVVGPPAAAGGVNFDPTRYQLSSGTAPATSDEIAVDSWTAQRTGYQVGDKVRIIVNGTARHVTLNGIFSFEDTRIARGGTLTAFDDVTAKAQFAKTPDGYTSVVLNAAPGTSDSALAASITATLPKDFIAETSAEIRRPEQDGKLTQILLIFAGVALFASIFLVANTFTMLSAARAREHALLRAVGADRRHVLRMVLTEALLLGGFATVVGYVLGIGAAALLGELFAVTDGPPVPPRVFGVGPILAALGVGLGVTLVAAYLPARRAAAVPPIAALRTGLPPTGKSLRRRNIAGVAMTAVGLAVTLAGINTQDLVYIGAPLLMLGLIVLTPLFGVGVTALLRRPMTRLAGIRGTLAVENTRRNPRRTGTTASALMISLSICAAVTVPIASVAAETERAADTGDSADVRIGAIPFADINPGASDQAAKVPGVTAVTPITTANMELDNGWLDAAGVNASTIGQLVPFTVHSGSLDGLAGGIAVNSSAAATHDWTVGSVVHTPQPLTVVAIFDAPKGFGYEAIVDTAHVPADSTTRTILVKTAPGQADAVRDAIRGTLDNPTLVVQTRAEYIAAQGAEFDVFLNILYALLSISVLIGALSVINTITMSTLERVREIGLLRAVGLARRQVGTIVRLESVIIAVIGAAAGLAAGCAIGAVAVLSQGDIPVVMPWGRLGLFVALTAAIGVLAALIPARKAARIPILKAIHTGTE